MAEGLDEISTVQLVLAPGKGWKQGDGALRLLYLGSPELSVFKSCEALNLLTAPTALCSWLTGSPSGKEISVFPSATGKPHIKQGSSTACFPKLSCFSAGFQYFLSIYHIPFAFALSPAVFPFPVNPVVPNTSAKQCSELSSDLSCAPGGDPE